MVEKGRDEGKKGGREKVEGKEERREGGKSYAHWIQISIVNN